MMGRNEVALNRGAFEKTHNDAPLTPALSPQAGRGGDHYVSMLGTGESSQARRWCSPY